MEINNKLHTITCTLCLKFKKHASKHLLSTIKSSFSLFEYIEKTRLNFNLNGFGI